MKIRKYEEMEQLVASSSSGSALVAAGPDLYQSMRLQEKITARFRDVLHYDVLRREGGELAGGDLKRLLMESSLFTSGQLLVISKAHSLGKPSVAELLDCLQNGVRDSAIFLASRKVPRESALIRKLEKLVPVYICYEPFDRDMPGWASRMASEEDIKLKRDGLALLTEYAGRDLQRLSGAVTRLALYHGPGSVLDREKVLEVLSGRGGMDVFRLGDMIFSNRRGEAIDSAVSLLQQGEEPIRILAYLYSLWQKVTAAGDVLRRGGGRKEVTAETGARYPLLDKLIRFAGNNPGQDAIAAAEAFAEADHGAKSGEDDMVVLARLIFTLTRGPQ